MSVESENLNANSAAVLAYLSALQDTIKRLASNSSQCKAWCITITSAIVVLAARTTAPNHAWIGIVPIITFCFLDAYYLSLEREFIKAFAVAADKVRNQAITLGDLFIFPEPRSQPIGEKIGRLTSAFASSSVTPFYIFLLLTLAFVRVAVLTST
jgi:hypothetical protein